MSVNYPKNTEMSNETRSSELVKVRIAGKNIFISSAHHQVAELCRDYLAAFDDCDFAVSVTSSDIEYEREKSIAEAIAEKRAVCDYSDDYLETLAVYRKISTAMLDYGVFLVHGAAVAVDDRCYVFIAKSGTGKTTHIKNWLKMIPGAFVVNGDKPLIDTVNMRVCGTPWSGKEMMNTNTAVRLEGLIVLERGEKNEIHSISFGDALGAVLQQSYRPDDTTKLKRSLELIGRLKDVPCYRLFCNMEEESAIVAYNGLQTQ